MILLNGIALGAISLCSLFAADAWEMGDRSYDAAMYGVYDPEESPCERVNAEIAELRRTTEYKSLKEEFNLLGKRLALRGSLLRSFRDTFAQAYINAYRKGKDRKSAVLHARERANKCLVFFIEEKSKKKSLSDALKAAIEKAK